MNFKYLKEKQQISYLSGYRLCLNEMLAASLCTSRIAAGDFVPNFP